MQRANSIRPALSNKLAKLNLGFIEVLAATSESAFADQLKSMLARYQGLHAIALTNPDMDVTARRLKEVGVEMQDAVHMRRKVMVNGEETLMLFTILRAKPGTYTEGRLQIQRIIRLKISGFPAIWIMKTMPIP